MTIDPEAVVEEVMWRGAIRDHASAKAAVEVVLRALALNLSRGDADTLAEVLPSPFASMFERDNVAAPPDPRTVCAALAASHNISLGHAVEHVRAVCDAMVGALDPELRALLWRRIPAQWTDLLVGPAPALESKAPPGTVPGHGHTLATGRSGSRRPLAEARPPAAQADSVITDDNPHAASKLSSGSTPVGAQPLSSARFGGESSIADFKDERSDRRGQRGGSCHVPYRQRCWWLPSLGSGAGRALRQCVPTR